MYFIMPIVIQLPFVAFMLKFQRRSFKIDHFKLLSLVSRTEGAVYKSSFKGDYVFFHPGSRDLFSKYLP